MDLSLPADLASGQSLASLTTLASQPININEASSINYWVSTLHCSELELRVAVAEVGTLPGDVGSELGRGL